jgi:glucose-1-phosphate thymidylyltransferase
MGTMIKTKGIILAGGSGTRLYPMTKAVSKQLLPVFDKPMIYYPLSTLMLAGIREILIISTPQDIERFNILFGDGSKLGIMIKYAIQKNPSGIAESFIIGEDFIGKDNCALILGDNLFFGNQLQTHLKDSIENLKGASLFAYPVKDPERYGVAEFSSSGKLISIEEKPSKPKSKFALTGLYIYENSVIDIAKNLSPSKRGELEISDVNKIFLKRGKISVEIFGRGMTWLDTGTADSLMEAGEFVKVIQKRQGLIISCPEEISWRNGWLSKEKLISVASSYKNSEYKDYLIEITSFN